MLTPPVYKTPCFAVFQRTIPASSSRPLADLKGGQGGAWTTLKFLYSLYIIEKY
jgi:hypothetical protein